MARSVTVGGFSMDAVSADGTEFTTADLAGWRGSPGTTVSVTQRPAAHGGWASANPVLVPRELELTVSVCAPDDSAMTSAYDQLVSAVGIGPVELSVTEDGVTRRADVYRNGDILPVEDYGDSATYSIPLVAPDPRRYAPAQQVTINLPSSSGGLSWPVSWPISWPATAVYGDFGLPAGGSISSPLRMVIYGPLSGVTPLVDPTITATYADGSVHSLAYAGSIGVGDRLVIDCEAKSVLYNGVSGRRALTTVINEWPEVPKGGALISFRAGNYDATARAVITYSPAWM